VREFIGHQMQFATRSMGIVKGLLVDDRPAMLLVKGADGKIVHVLKQDLGGFTACDFEPSEYIPFLVLFCENKKTGCPGIQYVKEGEGFAKNDLDIFTNPCPSKCSDCVMGSKGELRSVSGNILRGMLAGTMFGEYPKKEVKRGNSDIRPSTETPKGKGKGGGVRKGEEPAVG
jgi:hypothetical protein